MFKFFISQNDKEEETALKPSVAGSKSKLPKPVQELVALIFDVDTMKKSLVEFEVGLTIAWTLLPKILCVCDSIKKWSEILKTINPKGFQGR